MKQLGVAIIGTGFMSWVHVEALRRIGVRVVGILGSNTNKSQTAAASLGIDRAYNAYADVLADQQVDSVHIATPNRLHFEMARRALE
ncbi:MAG: Gfo/Idh/MocA family oxidoreductase, partial [Planctomycetales bacterium]|nr:Gfo/Idh/MocA family oxidoreductase [Planctomycetales bacterium]